jgi:FkbM family methyltransferase
MDLLKISYSRSGAPLEILKHLSKSNPITFFDIGANAGHFSLSISGEYQIEKGIIIEPISKLIPSLKKKFPDKKIFQIINVAVSDSNSETDFYIHNELDYVSSLLKIHNKIDELSALNIEEAPSTKIQTLTLDYIFKQQQLKQVDLIKIDVQGAEHLVLKGGVETLKNTKLVYTEFSFKPLYEQSSIFKDLYEFLYVNDFVLVNISPGYTSSIGELLQGDALFINKRMIN